MNYRQICLSKGFLSFPKRASGQRLFEEGWRVRAFGSLPDLGCPNHTGGVSKLQFLAFFDFMWELPASYRRCLGTPISHQQGPFPAPETGKIAVKVINHYGDEVMKVYAV